MSTVKKLKALWRIVEMNVKMFGIHGFYMMFQSRGTIDWETAVEDALVGSTHRPAELIGGMKLVREYVIKQMARGYRVDIGEDFITVWPNIVGKIKDSVDPSTGKTIAVTPEQLQTDDGQTKVGCTVSKRLTKDLSHKIEWKKIGLNGSESSDQEELVDDTENPNDNPETIPTIDTSTNTADPSTGGGNDGMD